MLAPSLFWAGGVIEEEALGFLRNYWGDRTVLQRIFDPRGYDYYQGRELSYAVDFLDAQWVRLVLGRGWMYFVPPSALAASLAVVLAWGIGLPRALPGLDRVDAWCLLLVYLSNFAVLSTMGLLYRSAKPLVPPLLLAVLLLRAPAAAGAAGRAPDVLRVGVRPVPGDEPPRPPGPLLHRVPHRRPRGRLGPHRRRRPPRRGRRRRRSATWALYNYLVGPWIIHAVNGYWPEFRFQRFRPSRLCGRRPWLAAGRAPAATGRPSSWAASRSGFPRPAGPCFCSSISAGESRRRPARRSAWPRCSCSPWPPRWPWWP